MALVKGIVVNSFSQPSRDPSKPARKVVQILLPSDLRVVLVDVGDMSPEGLRVNVGEHISLECRVGHYNGYIQYSYWGSSQAGGEFAMRKLFGNAMPPAGDVDVDLFKGKGVVPINGDLEKDKKDVKAPFK